VRVWSSGSKVWGLRGSDFISMVKEFIMMQFCSELQRICLFALGSATLDLNLPGSRFTG
jgi:hypothetical protein